MNIDSIKLKLDNFGMIYYHYLRFRETFFPTKFQKVERQRRLERLAFYSQFIAQSDLVFDIGANYGNRTSTFLALGAKVIALEPQQHCLKYLRKMFGKRVVIVPKVVSNSLGERQLFYSKTKISSGTASLSKGWIKSVSNSNRFQKEDWNQSQRVQSTTMNELIEKYGLPKFCKIDVEGHEIEVLEDLSKPIESLSFEFTTPERLEKVFEAIMLLKNLDPNYVFNFCIGEKLSFEKSHWLGYLQMVNELESNPVFYSEGIYGDIYCKIPQVGK
ncbi:MAG: FkbM family methyltransferase [Cyclobacteriaceae bacterium]